MLGSLTLFRVRGVPVRAHWTLLLVLPYLAVALSYQFADIAKLAGVDHAHLTLPPIAWGALLAVALFASVALHELAHTLVAIRYGGRVRSITLMLVGGVSQLARAPERPLHEALMAVAGPATSFLLGLVCFLGYAALGAGADFQMGLFYLGAINMSLGAFNLLPAFPMDGGRVLRAVLASRIGRPRATRIAAAVGKACAVGLAILAIVQLNLLLGLIALFVYSGASGESAAETITQTFGRLRVTDLLPSHQPVPVIDANAHVDEVLRTMADLDRLELVVTDRRGPVAIIEADDVSRLSEADRRLPLAALARQLPARFVTVSQSAAANQALDAAADERAAFIVVVDPPSAVIGLVGPQDLARTLKLRTVRRLPEAAHSAS